MLHNNGSYGPNEAPMNVGAPVNMKQINISSNLNNLGKIAQQPAQTPSTHYNLPNYANFGHPQLSLNPQMSPFSNYQPLGFQSSYLTQNLASAHENNWQNGMLPMNLNIQSTHDHNTLNYQTNFNKIPPDLAENYKEQNITKKMIPLNIPEVPMKSFQKLDNDNGNYSPYNVNKDKYNYVNYNLDLNSKPEKPLLDNTRRKSLENTVRLIENILINTTKNKDLQRIQNLKKITESNSKTTENITEQKETPKIPEKLTNEQNINKNLSNDTNTTIKEIDSKTDDEDMITETEQSSSESEEDVKPSIEQLKITVEIDTNIDVKVESVYWTDTDFMNPFHRDVNATMRDDVTSEIVDCENSVNEATSDIKSGTKTESHYECPHCNILFSHPKRFLIHNKWHTFGLTNEKRMEIAREREVLRNQRKEARVVDRMNSMEVTDAAGKKVYQCKDCEKAFSSKSSLKNHRQRYHPTRVRECKICRKTVVGWIALRAHLASHTHEAGYQCADCPKKFKYAHSLAKHRDTHLEKTLSCEQCPKMFGSTAQLKMHQKVHERAQRGTTFRCSYCAKGFYEAYNLAVHERTHRNERPFLCDICNTSFGTNSSLKRHLKVSHSTSKPYSCSTCKRSFVSAVIRDRHELRQHGDPALFNFTCDLCECRYMKLKDLQKHVYKAHPKGKRKKKEHSDSE